MKKHELRNLTGKKILFATVPADGHVNPLTGLAKHLLQQGNEVKWYTSAIFHDKIRKLGIPLYPFVQAMDFNSERADLLITTRKGIDDAGERLNFDMTNIFTRRGPEYYRDLQDIRSEFPFDLVIADSLFTGIPFIRQKMKVPVVSIGVVPLAEESVDLAPYGTGLPPARNAAERRTYADLRKHLGNEVFGESNRVLYEIMEEHGIAHERSGLFDLLVKQADLYLQIGSPSFEYPRTDQGSNIRYIGALLPYSAGTSTHWFDPRLTRYETIILVTQGTVETDHNKILIPALTAFRGTGTLVIATTGGHGTDALKTLFPDDNFIIEDYIAFNDAMPFVDAFVTNGGYSGTMLSLSNGVPMIAAGIHEGKSEICARIGYFNLGINLGTETPDAKAVKDAVDKVTGNPMYKQNVVRLYNEMLTMDPLAVATDYIAVILEKKSQKLSIVDSGGVGPDY